MSFKIFPEPAKIVLSKTVFDHSQLRYIVCDSLLSDGFMARCREFRDAVQPFFPRALQVSAVAPHSELPLLSVKLTKGAVKGQGYKLNPLKAGGIELCAGDEAGAFYGLETLRQIIEQTGCRMPAFEITDSPDFPARGVMLDVSRAKVPSMQTLRELINTMARLKFNQLQLYIEHTFAFAAHEAVWHESSPFTADEIVELDAFCRERYIELVPNFNSFGHFGRWLAHPEYKNLAECPDESYPQVLKPDRSSINFLDTLYAEYLPNFKSRLFNVGCDETWELGKGWSKKICDAKGVTRVYVDHLLNIGKLTCRHGRQMMFWADIVIEHPEFVKELPKDIIALEWGYEAKSPFESRCPVYKKAGVPFYVCPGTSSWNALTGRTENALENLANAAENGLKNGSVGYLITDWGDGGHHQYQPISYTGFTAGAGYSWSFQANKKSDIAEAMDRLIFRDSAGITGRLLMELGNVYKIIPRCPGNGTIFNSLLFREIGAVSKDLKAADLKKCFSPLNRLEALLADTRMSCDDAFLIKKEIGNAIAMTRLAVKRGLMGLGSKAYKKTEIRADMQGVVEAHQMLWLARNRVGGLRESITRLRERMDS